MKIYNLIITFFFFAFVSAQKYDSIIDSRDGQIYKVIKLGNQWWMAENLNVGEMIDGGVNQQDNGIIEKYCYNNDTSRCLECGGLYQWNEMMQYTTGESARGICPENWHVPSDAEWKELEIFLGMSQSDVDKENTWRGSPVGTKLKEGGTSGYDEKLCGRRNSDGTFAWDGRYGYPYTSTEHGSNAWRRCLDVNASSVGRWNTFPKNYAFSVRCITDSIPTSITSNNVLQLVIAPNPTHDHIKIYYTEFLFAEIFNLVGNKLKTVEQPYVSFNGLTEGIYIVKIYSKMGNIITKKVKYFAR